jgi:hypothetical protein
MHSRARVRTAVPLRMYMDKCVCAATATAALPLLRKKGCWFTATAACTWALLHATTTLHINRPHNFSDSCPANRALIELCSALLATCMVATRHQCAVALSLKAHYAVIGVLAQDSSWR